MLVIKVGRYRTYARADPEVKKGKIPLKARKENLSENEKQTQSKEFQNYVLRILRYRLFIKV